jgi:hypothetical protein
MHPARPYCWLWKGRHPAHQYYWRWKGIQHACPLSIWLAAEIITPCTSILLAVEMVTPCSSILLAVERDTPCLHSAGYRREDTLVHQYYWRWKGVYHACPIVHTAGCGNRYTLHVHTADGGKGRHPTCPYCRLCNGIHPARPFSWLWKCTVVRMEE